MRASRSFFTLILTLSSFAGAQSAGTHLSRWLPEAQVRSSGNRATAAADVSAKELGKLTASDGQFDDVFGNAVALDGDTIVVGNESAAIGKNLQQGAAYVFVKPANGWHSMTQTAKLTASDGQEFDDFGISVAIRGNTIAIGANCHPWKEGRCPGAVYIFEKPESGWADMTQTAELTASDDNSPYGFALGWSVAIGPDYTVTAGAILAAANGGGAVYVFPKPQGGWKNMTQTAELTASDGQPMNALGESVSYVGNTVAAGAIGWPNGAGNKCCQGAAYIFAKPAKGWENATETARLNQPHREQRDNFGVSLSFDPSAENLISAGAAGTPVNGERPRAVYVFSKPSGGWKTTSTATARITAYDGQVKDGFGSAVGVEENLIAAGAPGFSNFQGAAYLYQKPAEGWKTTSKYDVRLSFHARRYDFFGGALALQGNTLVIGADLEKPAGAAYVFQTGP
jgi:FG-GAP repeat protein